MYETENKLGYEVDEEISKLLRGETVDFNERDYTITLEQTQLYKAIVYKRKDNSDIVKKIFDIIVNKSLDKRNDNYLLPIGSVVSVEGTSYMIISRWMKDDKNHFDYVGVKFPQGFIDTNTYNFQQENIERILHVGHENEENSALTLAIKKELDKQTGKNIWFEKNISSYTHSIFEDNKFILEIEQFKELNGNARATFVENVEIYMPLHK